MDTTLYWLKQKFLKRISAFRPQQHSFSLPRIWPNFSTKKKEINSNYAKISLELHNLVKEAINRLKCKTIPNKFRHDHKKDSLPFSQKHFFPIHIHCACIVWEKGKKEFSSIFRFIFCNYDFATIFFYLKDGSLRLIFRENSKI